ncbi:MAG: transcription termination/antitermination protein NusA [Candidatus Harrisonbacteria bacterium CG10_big_fil_rev_8_21_14_0_10_44_23]|uniref:Transcription termination/antitermination protein NusA n=1 Tax=Candidatus Harrisonbacteria bacterium CG10_big_fil_rev_8_21_14_0_10_44_23 TaxID=1974585 RepID=A0A2H0URW0_9BACT|nr:MAG: transcription termination/antitermination protein NusA [Candidatus Harrisonbacteria bacterium CG10_big_fil_rev_8_21_14_0_10_44_23]
MLDLKDLQRAVEQVAEEKGIDPDRVMEAIESSIAAAYKKEYEKRGEIIKAKIDPKSGKLNFWQVKTVVDETTVRIVEKTEEEELAEEEAIDKEAPEIEEEEEEDEEGKLPRYNPVRHIMIDEAKEIKKDAELGEDLIFPLETHDDFGRIAAQAAKQVVLQKLREAERESIVKEFKGREGEVVSGLVQRFERGNTYIDLGRATGVMPYREGIPGERYRIGERLKFYIQKVDDESRVPAIILSRADAQFVAKLFEVEIPEITDGTIEIMGIAREAGSRTKVAVKSNEEGVDPVGSCVGQRGTRIMAVSNELGQERIDVIEYSEDPAEYISAALSPAEAEEVEILQNQEARVFVPNDELSLAIGRRGQNVRLAAKLTSWKIDVRSMGAPEEEQEGGVAVAEEGDDLPVEEVGRKLEPEEKTEAKPEEKSDEKTEAKEDSKEAEEENK